MTDPFFDLSGDFAKMLNRAFDTAKAKAPRKLEGDLVVSVEGQKSALFRSPSGGYFMAHSERDDPVGRPRRVSIAQAARIIKRAWGLDGVSQTTGRAFLRLMQDLADAAEARESKG